MPLISTSLSPPLKCVIKPEFFSLEHWKKVLWVAKDLKETVTQNKKKNLELLGSKHVTLIFTKPHGWFQLAYSLACDLLGTRKTLYCDPHFENQIFPNDGGRWDILRLTTLLSLLTDMLIFHDVSHYNLKKTISEVTVPVFSASSDVYYLQKALSDLMTFWEIHKRLHGLNLAWIGPPNPTFNSYLTLCSKFGINIRYLCICKFGTGKMSPVFRFPNNNGGETIDLKEYQTVEEAVSGAHIIATSMHPEEENRITLEIFKKADSNCVFLHSLPRSSVEVSDEVFNLDSNISWKSIENYLFIAMAIILTNLEEYQPKISMPTF